MSLTVVLGSFFTAVTMFLSSTADVFLDLPVRGVLLSTPVVSFFLRRFQMVVLAIASVCAMVWLIFHLLSASIARFSPIDTSLVFMLVTRLTNYKCSLHGSETERRHSVLFIVWIINRTHQGNKTHLSVTCSNTFGNMSNGWVQTKGNKSWNVNLSSHIHLLMSNPNVFSLQQK